MNKYVIEIEKSPAYLKVCWR